jgi:hypothetical protein
MLSMAPSEEDRARKLWLSASSKCAVLTRHVTNSTSQPLSLLGAFQVTEEAIAFS